MLAYKLSKSGHVALANGFFEPKSYRGQHRMSICQSCLMSLMSNGI